MRRASLRGVLAGALLLCAGAASAAPGVPWAKSFDAAMADAKKKQKLVMVDFYTEW